MKILWITNILFPDVCKELGMPEPVIGGWLYSSAKRLNVEQDVELAIATLYDGKELKKLVINNVTYFLLPFSGDRSKYSVDLESFWKNIQLDYKPDLVHVHGTEFAFGLAYIKECSNKNVVVSIQGLVSVYERYYYAGIEVKEILRNITFRDIVKGNIFQQRRKMCLNGEIEKEYIRSVKHIIGRTSWDKMHVRTINPATQYHFCNETLREDFFKYEWSYNTCEKYSIFLSQAYCPIKGLHQVLKALPIILKRFPETKVYVAGYDLIAADTFKQKIRLSGYAKYLRSLIKKNGLKEKIIFKGTLSEKEIVQRYLASNVFVCPSSIENSPNSVGEAQLLGVPCVASYVGGIPDMIEHGKTGLLYRFEEVEMLANLVCSIFSDQDLAIRLSDHEHQEALKRHSPTKNAETLMTIYKKMGFKVSKELVI